MFNFTMRDLGKRQKKKKNGGEKSPKTKRTAEEQNDDLNWQMPSSEQEQLRSTERMQDTLYGGTEPSLQGDTQQPIGEVKISLSKKQLTITTREKKGEKKKVKRGRARTRSPDRLDSGSEDGERAACEEVEKLSMS